MNSSPEAMPNDRREKKSVQLIEALIVYGLTTLIISIAIRLPWAWFKEYVPLLVATLFLYVPILILWLRKQSLSKYGLRVQPLWPALRAYILLAFGVFPLFSLVYYLIWRNHLCQRLFIPPMLIHCSSGSPIPPPPPKFFILWILSTVVLTALPEECFFRGYLQGRFSEITSPKFAILGSSILFALGHVASLGNPALLLVFFPGLLFGWLRLRTGSIVAGVLFHASANILMVCLHHFFF